MNSLIKAMLSLDRRSKSVDSPNRIEKKASRNNNDKKKNSSSVKTKQIKVTKEAMIEPPPSPNLNVSSSPRTTKYLEIPSIRYNLSSKSFDEGLDNLRCLTKGNGGGNMKKGGMDDSEDESAITISLSPTTSTSTRRPSRISFFTFSKIGKRIRQKLSSSSSNNNAAKRSLDVVSKSPSLNSIKTTADETRSLSPQLHQHGRSDDSPFYSLSTNDLRVNRISPNQSINVSLSSSKLPMVI